MDRKCQTFGCRISYTCRPGYELVGVKHNLCHFYQLSPHNQANPTIFDKGKTISKHFSVEHLSLSHSYLNTVHCTKPSVYSDVGYLTHADLGYKLVGVQKYFCWIFSALRCKVSDSATESFYGDFTIISLIQIFQVYSYLKRNHKLHTLCTALPANFKKYRTPR